MGLSVYLTVEEPITVSSTGIFVREGGRNRELSLTEAKERYPDEDIKVHTYETNELFSDSITHNLTEMAKEAGLYDALWRPYRLSRDWEDFSQGEYDYYTELDFENEQSMVAYDLINTLALGLSNLIKSKDELLKYNPENGWGSYESLLEFTKGYLMACIENPDAKVEVSR